MTLKPRLKRYLISSALMMIGMFFTLNFFAMGCVIDLSEQLRFAFGAFIYVTGTLVFLVSDNFQMNKALRQLPLFLLLNIPCVMIAYSLQSLYILESYF